MAAGYPKKITCTNKCFINGRLYRPGNVVEVRSKEEEKAFELHFEIPKTTRGSGEKNEE